MNSINYACTYAYVHGKSALQSMGNKVKNRLAEVKNDESGMEVVAVILILAVVIALVIIFRSYIIDFVKKIWTKIFGMTGVDEESSHTGTDADKGTVFARLLI